MQETRSGLTNTGKQDSAAQSVQAGQLPMEQPTAKAMWRLLLFFIFYMIFRLLVETAISVGFLAFGPGMPEPFRSFFMMPSDSPEMEMMLSGNSQVLVSAVGFIVAGLMIRAKAFEYDGKYSPKKETGKQFYILAAIASVSIAIFMNILIVKSGIIAISDEYAEVAENQYACSFIVGFIVYGFISPISEELMFRGILYNGFKRYFKMTAALLMSAAFFSIYHGNGIQGMYSFVVSVFIIYSYEHTGNFLMPVMIHMICNLTAYVMTYEYELMSEKTILAIFAASFVVSAACIVLMFFRDKIPVLKKAADE